MSDETTQDKLERARDEARETKEAGISQVLEGKTKEERVEGVLTAMNGRRDEMNADHSLTLLAFLEKHS